MITHTSIFSFEPAMTEQDVDRFFGEMREIVERTGLVTGFAYQPNIPEEHDRYAPVFTASALAQIRVAKVEDFGPILEDPALGEFLDRWLSGPLPHRVVWINTSEPLLS